MERRIRGSLIAIGCVGLLAVGAYIGWFAGHLAKGISDDPAVWGQFGDYLGGFLNPLIAAAAFYWLTQSVRIQHDELKESRQALQDAAAAQREASAAQTKQVELMALTAQLNAATAVIQAANSNIDQMHLRLEALRPALVSGGPTTDINGERCNFEEAISRTNALNQQLDATVARRSRAIALVEDVSMAVFELAPVQSARPPEQAEAPAANPHEP